MKTADALDRRVRFAPPNPRVQRIELNETDFLLFEHIDRHGPLPIHYLYELTKHFRRNKNHLQHRLTEFYNGDEGGPYLKRPAAQFNSFEARYQHIVYELTPRAKMVLASQGRLGKFPLKRNNDFVHDLMAACVSASIQIGAKENGLEYVARETILSRSGSSIGIEVPGTRLFPDDLFGLKGKDEKGDWYRFFAVEIDRNTESIETKTAGVPGKFGRKIEHYSHIIGTRSFKAHWDIPNLSVLTVTTNDQHARNMIAYVEKTQPKWKHKFLFQTETMFGTRLSEDADQFWRMPKGLLTHLLDPWQTTGEPRDITKP